MWILIFTRWFNLLLRGERWGNGTEVGEIKALCYLILAPNSQAKHFVVPKLIKKAQHKPFFPLYPGVPVMDRDRVLPDSCRSTEVTISPVGVQSHCNQVWHLQLPQSCRTAYMWRREIPGHRCQQSFSRNLKRNDWFRKTPWPKKSGTKIYCQPKRLKTLDHFFVKASEEQYTEKKKD